MFDTRTNRASAEDDEEVAEGDLSEEEEVIEEDPGQQQQPLEHRIPVRPLLNGSAKYL